MLCSVPLLVLPQLLSLLRSYSAARPELLSINTETNLPTPRKLGTSLYKKVGTSATWLGGVSTQGNDYRTHRHLLRESRIDDFLDREPSLSTQRTGMELKAKEQVQQTEKARFTAGSFRVRETIGYVCRHIAGVT